MSACQVVGAGPWADGAAARLAALGHDVARVAAHDRSGAVWAFVEGDRRTVCHWLTIGQGTARQGAAAAQRWHDVYGEDGAP